MLLGTFAFYMPNPPSPPPADESGAIVSPRTLNRWLDVNPVHKLTRTQTYLTVPAFDIDTTWLGYSLLVGAYNFTATRNFVLKSFTTPTNPNYVLCVMWEDVNYVTHRYALWTGVGELFYFNCPLYTGQLIMKNFRFEVWTAEDETTATQTTDLTFYSSVLGNVDYMNGDDNALSSPSAVIVDFAESNVVPALPDDINNQMLHRFISTAGFTAGVSWADQKGTGLLLSADLVTSYIESAYHTIQSSGAPASTAIDGTQTYAFMSVYIATGASGPLLTFDGKPSVSISAGSNQITVNGQTTVLNGVNKLYFIHIINNLSLILIDAKTGQQSIVVPVWAAAGLSTLLDNVLDLGGDGIVSYLAGGNVNIKYFGCLYSTSTEFDSRHSAISNLTCSHCQCSDDRITKCAANQITSLSITC